VYGWEPEPYYNLSQVFIAVLLHNSGFCNKCTPKRCLQTHYKTPFSQNGYIKSLKFYENYITLFCLEKKLFDNIILAQNHAWRMVVLTI
jgi:hypothetical protein